MEIRVDMIKRWLVILALVGLFAPINASAPGGSGQSQPELRFTLHMVCNASYSTADQGSSQHDNLSVTFEERDVYRITQYDHMGQAVLELASHQANLSAAGGGSFVVPPVVSESWTYQVDQDRLKELQSYSRISLSVSFTEGWLSVSDPNEICGYVKASSERGQLGGMAGMDLEPIATAFGHALPRSTFKPNSTSIGVNGHNIFNSDPKIKPFVISQQVEYSVTGGDTELAEVELIPPEGYEMWEPQAGEDESTLGNFLDVQIVAHKKGDPNADPPKKVKKYTIELEDTSREKGVDLNWPPEEKAKNDFDMKIDKDNPWISVLDGNNAQKAETKQEGLTQFMVTVNSYDWGGYTKLHVTAELEDGSSVVGYVRGHPDQDFLLIPKDDNLNHIADWWEHWFDIKNRDASADDDDQPHSDAGKGDSIALYDEYRGFHIQGRHERLSPEIKDLFVWDPHRLGVGIYGVTGIHVHVISDDEFASKLGANNTNVVTPNGSHGDVYAILLTKGSIEAGVVGDTVGGPGVPRDIRKVVIDPDLIARAYGDYAAAELQSTIAHELSHATNVWHHDGEPPPDYDIGEARCQVPDESGRPGTEGTKVTVNLPCNKMPRDKNGKAIGPGQPAFDCFEVAAKGGKYSGNDQCWMRYDMTNFYEDEDGNCQWQHHGKTVKGSKYGMDPPGMTMCESPDGTGVNDTKKKPDKAGNAMRGNCKNQLRLK